MDANQPRYLHIHGVFFVVAGSDGQFIYGGLIWVWVNTYRYIFSGMNIHLPAILGFTRYQGFDPSPYDINLW